MEREWEVRNAFSRVVVVLIEKCCRILASGSDDMNIILWDPFRYKSLKVLRTRHVGNIFSVKVSKSESKRSLLHVLGVVVFRGWFFDRDWCGRYQSDCTVS